MSKPVFDDAVARMLMNAGAASANRFDSFYESARALERAEKDGDQVALKKLNLSPIPTVCGFDPRNDNY